ncbi:hypothetical protein D3C80_2089890 [compost metagenome]
MMGVVVEVVVVAGEVQRVVVGSRRVEMALAWVQMVDFGFEDKPSLDKQKLVVVAVAVEAVVVVVGAEEPGTNE